MHTRPSTHPRPTRWALALLGTLIFGASCRSQDGLTVVNHSGEVITAVFGRDGEDLLEGRTLPPDTFVQLPPESIDTGPGPALEAYTLSGACAPAPTPPGARWEIAADALDPGGC